MKLFNCVVVEDYVKLIEHITELDQPVYIYNSDDFINYVLVSPTEIENVDDKIQELMEEKKEEKSKDEINNDDEPIWEDGDDIPLDWLIM